MAVRANLIVGAIGAVLALVSGTYIAVNWETLVGLETWEARFETHDVRLPERAASVAPGTTRNEAYEVAAFNVTHINVDFTWSDPAFNPPEVTVRLLDPSRSVRAEQTHTGGASGIHLQVHLLPPGDEPRGVKTFNVRNDPQDLNARNAFETRWPTHDETRGTWTIEIRSTAPSGPAPSGNVLYTLRAEYEYYTGTFTRVPEPMR